MIQVYKEIIKVREFLKTAWEVLWEGRHNSSIYSGTLPVIRTLHLRLASSGTYQCSVKGSRCSAVEVLTVKITGTKVPKPACFSMTSLSHYSWLPFHAIPFSINWLTLRCSGPRRVTTAFIRYNCISSWYYGDNGCAFSTWSDAGPSWSFSKHCLFRCSLCEASQGKDSGFIVSSGHTLDTWVPEMQKTALHLFLTLSPSLGMTLSMGRAHPFRLTKVKRMSKGVSHVTGTNMLLSDRI